MDFELTADQESLQEGIRAFLDGRFSPDTVREIEATGGLDRARWAELAETGVFSLLLPEADDGLGLGVSEAALVFEELGRALVPGPLVGTLLAASLIADAATGEAVVGLLEPAEPVTVLENPDDVDAVLLLAADGIRRLDPATIPTTAVDVPLDALTPIRLVSGPIPSGELIAGPEAVAPARLQGIVLTAALQLGLALRTVELATDYAKEREQFGRPIGSFQAIKHMCADMLVRAEVARAAVYAAAVALDGRSDDDPARGVGGQDPRRGCRDREQQDRDPGARGHRVHVGGRRPALLEARVGARHPLR